MENLQRREVAAINIPPGALPLDVTFSSSQQGAFIIGLYFALFGYGVLLFMNWLYFYRFTDDPRRLKVLVLAVMAVVMFGIITSCIEVYNQFVANFGDAATLGYAVWTRNIVWLNTSLVAVMVQTFYAWRIHRLTESKLLPAFIGVVSFIGLPFNTAFFGLQQTTQGPYIDAARISSFSWVADVGQALSATADIAILVGMVMGMLHIKKLGLVSREQKHITRVLNASFDTNVITAAFAICVIATWETGFGIISQVFLILNMVLYAFSLLLGLLNRRSDSDLPESEPVEVDSMTQAWIDRAEGTPRAVAEARIPQATVQLNRGTRVPAPRVERNSSSTVDEKEKVEV